jgi:hypothetical protein
MSRFRVAQLGQVINLPFATTRRGDCVRWRKPGSHHSVRRSVRVPQVHKLRQELGSGIEAADMPSSTDVPDPCTLSKGLLRPLRLCSFRRAV